MVADMPKGHAAIQRYLSRLEKCADSIFMKFTRSSANFCIWGGTTLCTKICLGESNRKAF